MLHVMIQFAFLILAAAVLGFVLGWMVRGSRSDRELSGVSARIAGLERERNAARRATKLATEKAETLESQYEECTRAGELQAREPDGLKGTELPALQSRIAELEREQANAEAASQRIVELVADRDAAQAALSEEEKTRAELEKRLADLEQVRGRSAPDATSPHASNTAEATSTGEPAATANAATGGPKTPPASLGGPDGPPDDLKRISGIGPRIAGVLNELGIYHFHQIAAFTPENVAWIGEHLRFKGRIEREKWIEQAKQLAAARGRE